MSKTGILDARIRREIGPVTATCIVIANMVGAGIFTTSGIMAAQLPDSGWVILDLISSIGES